MDAIASLRENLASAHWTLDGTLQGLSSEQLHWLPTGSAHSIAASLAHIVLGEDMILNGMLKGAPPLAATSWAGRTGVSEMPPQGSEGPGDWSDWARRVKVDMAALQEFAQAVYANSDAYLASLKPSDLDEKINTFPGIGEQTRNWMIGVLIGHANNHAGEVAAIKGAQGLQGYPF